MQNNRAEIAKLFKDNTLSPRTKHRKIAELMNVKTSVDIEDSDSESEIEECPHYQRGCLVECNVCLEFVNCRLCHTHLDRFKIENVKCKKCSRIQTPRIECVEEECQNKFGEYYCDVCHLWDLTPDKPKFHCDKCGICRVGMKDNYLHCDNCGMCLRKEVFENQNEHRCRTSTFRDDCVVCREELFASTDPAQILRCGHAIHSKCFMQIAQRDYRCPTCKKSIVDMSNLFGYYDQVQASANVDSVLSGLPEEYRTKEVQRYCNDCEKVSTLKFNPFGLYKCSNEECGSYNTQ
jgi:RING finger/CHY zinc finger protein 1